MKVNEMFCKRLDSMQAATYEIDDPFQFRSERAH